MSMRSLAVMSVKKPSEVGHLLDQAECEACFDYLKSTPATVIINAGLITVTGDGWFVVDTEGASAADDLDRINGTSEGNIVQLRLASASRVVTIKHGAYLKLASAGGTGADFTMNSIYDLIEFRSFGDDVLVERHRSSNSA